MGVRACDEAETEKERERLIDRQRGVLVSSSLSIIVGQIYLSLGLRMRSMAFKESGSCLLPHLISKLCELRYIALWDRSLIKDNKCLLL